MNFGTSNEQDETGIELTPLIDVVFLLLIFFMISTTFTKETQLKINLPAASSDAVIDQPRTLEVQVSEASDYAVSTDQDTTGRVLINSNRDTLLRALTEYKDTPNLLLIIRADQKAPHDAVIRVLDVAQQIGLSNVTFATKQAIE